MAMCYIHSIVYCFVFISAFLCNRPALKCHLSISRSIKFQYKTDLMESIKLYSSNLIVSVQFEVVN